MSSQICLVPSLVESRKECKNIECKLLLPAAHTEPGPDDCKNEDHDLSCLSCLSCPGCSLFPNLQIRNQKPGPGVTWAQMIHVKNV